MTITAAVNADGGNKPPHMIRRGKTIRALNSFELEAAGNGTTWSVSDSGWIKPGIAKLWFEKNILLNIDNERPQILIVDGHDSHNFVELIETAVANKIIIIEFPAHTSN